MPDPGTPNRFQSHNLGQLLSSYFPSSGGVSYLISPFISQPALESVIGHRRTADTVIVTSWRPVFLRQGVSDLDCYRLASDRGWTFFINDALHAKFYSQHLESAWMGSANLTTRGLGGEHSNLEALYLIDPLGPAERTWVYRLMGASRLVTDDVHTAYRVWLSDHPLHPTDDDSVIFADAAVDPFLTTQLPASDSIDRLWHVVSSADPPPSPEDRAAAERDLANYEIAPCDSRTEFVERLGDAFLRHPFIDALARFVELGDRRFGEVKEWVQQTCTDVPTPYRRELTRSVQTLYSWLTELASERFELVQPRHTQVLRLAPDRERQPEEHTLGSRQQNRQPFRARVRNRDRGGPVLYIQVTTADVERLGFPDGSPVTVWIEGAPEIRGLFKTTGSTPWIAPIPHETTNDQISRTIRSAGLAHMDDIDAWIAMR